MPKCRVSQGPSPKHKAIDVACPRGTPLSLRIHSTVVRCGYEGAGYGHFVEVLVDGGSGVSVLLAHLERASPRSSGERVPAGGILGYVGSSGRSTGPHVHVEARQHGRKLHPAIIPHLIGA